MNIKKSPKTPYLIISAWLSIFMSSLVYSEAWTIRQTEKNGYKVQLEFFTNASNVTEPFPKGGFSHHPPLTIYTNAKYTGASKGLDCDEGALVVGLGCYTCPEDFDMNFFPHPDDQKKCYKTYSTATSYDGFYERELVENAGFSKRQVKCILDNENCYTGIIGALGGERYGIACGAYHGGHQKKLIDNLDKCCQAHDLRQWSKNINYSDIFDNEFCANNVNFARCVNKLLDGKHYFTEEERVAAQWSKNAVNIPFGTGCQADYLSNDAGQFPWSDEQCNEENRENCFTFNFEDKEWFEDPSRDITWEMQGGFLALRGFGYVTSGKWRVEEHIRTLADINGDGRDDIVGFGKSAVYTALGQANADFETQQYAHAEFGEDKGWSLLHHIRLMADINGDDMADIVGFGENGVYTAISRGNGTFAQIQFANSSFSNHYGWEVDQHPRVMADLNDDGKADIIGFKSEGVYTALSNGDGTFAYHQPAINDLGADNGWNVSDHIRLVKDINNDGYADIIAFGEDAYFISAGKGDGTFHPAVELHSDFSKSSGWRVKEDIRTLADLNDDGYPDIVGINDDGVHIAFNRKNNTFKAAVHVNNTFGSEKGWAASKHPRFVRDINQDGYADILGINSRGVYVTHGDGYGGFNPAIFVASGFNYSRWSRQKHPRMLAQYDSSGAISVIGFGNIGVRVKQIQ